jgi:glycosyltransferase involved in cell wall biosynthesis
LVKHGVVDSDFWLSSDGLGSSLRRRWSYAVRGGVIPDSTVHVGALVTDIAVIFHRLGPYHHARLSALAGGCALRAIELSRVDQTYAWEEIHSGGPFPISTLFSDGDVDDKPVAEVVGRVWGILDQFAPHVVAIPGWSSVAALAALTWCDQSGTPSILLSDSSYHDEPRIRWKEWVKSRLVRQHSSALVAGFSHVDYVTMLGMPRQRTFTGYDVVDNEYFRDRADAVRSHGKEERARLGLPDSYVLASCRFVAKKNLPRLVEAYARYAFSAGVQAWHLVMLGDGLLREALRLQVERLGLRDKVKFVGFRQYSELPAYYGLAKAFVHTSTSEQWGLVVNEAMASGLPVLVSNRCGCAPDLVSEGVNGFTMDPYDVGSMAARMSQIAGGTYDLAAMGRASREIVGAWSPETFADGMLKAAEAALASPRPRTGIFDRLLLSLLMRR